jgi:hypothetical protein
MHRSAICLAAAAASMIALTTAAMGATPLSFEGIELGTTEAAWRALKPPGPTPQHARRACSDDPDGAAAGLKADGLPSGAVVCGMVDVYGRYRLPVTFPWRRQYQVDHLRFVFQHGRLSEIRALLPDDAFDALMANFKQSYGPPSKTVRDFVPAEIGKLPRLTQTWTLPQGHIELIDPATPGKLSVRLSAPTRSRS